MATLEDNLKTWLAASVGMDCYYQHVDSVPAGEFLWFTRAGDETLDCMDESSEPDIVLFDLEIYADDHAELQTYSAALRAKRDFRGDLVANVYVDDVNIEDHRDDYEPQAPAENVPPYLAVFRITVSGYEDSN